MVNADLDGEEWTNVQEEVSNDKVRGNGQSLDQKNGSHQGRKLDESIFQLKGYGKGIYSATYGKDVERLVLKFETSLEKCMCILDPTKTKSILNPVDPEWAISYKINYSEREKEQTILDKKIKSNTKIS